MANYSKHEHLSRQAFLDAIAAHQLWLKSREAEGKKLDIKNLLIEQIYDNNIILNNCIITNCILNGSHLNFIDLSNSDLSGTDLSNTHMNGANLSHCNLRGCNLEGTQLNEAKLFCATLAGSRGLHTHPKALTNNTKDDEAAFLGCQLVKSNDPRDYRDPISWARIKSLAELPLLRSAGLVAVIIITISLSIQSFNNRIQQLNYSIKDRLTEQGESLLDDALEIVYPLAEISAPSHFGFTLAAIGLIAIANLIYRLSCPAIVQQYREPEWTHDLGKSWLEYQAASHTYSSQGRSRIEKVQFSFITRAAWCLLYVPSAAWLIYYLIAKGSKALDYLFSSTILHP